MTKICPVHGTEMYEVREGNVNIDSCRYGCVFLDPGELDHLLNAFGNQRGLPQQQYVPAVPEGRHVRDPKGWLSGVLGGGHSSHGSYGHERSSDHGHYGHGGGHRRHRESEGIFGSGGFFGSD